MSAVAEVQGSAVAFEDGLAPIILITGLPGAAKSLFLTSQFLKGKANVYQAGLKGSVFPATDAAKWFDTPHGATIGVDEAWKWFAPQPPTKEPPEHYTRLPEIRHEGRTLILVTQHPNDLDARVRRRIGKHYHLVRVFGSERSNVHVWDHCEENVESRGDTDSFIWEFDKEAYALYKSASLHKIKTEVPRRLKRVPYYIGGAALAVVVSIGGMYAMLTPDEVPGQSKAKKPSLIASAAGNAARNGQDRAREPMTAQQWVESRQPRIADLPHTAPAYDRITAPTVAPVIAACVESESKGCRCWTQQATPLKVSAEVCRQFVAGGMFQEFDQAPAREIAAPGQSGDRGSVPPAATAGQRASEAPAGVGRLL